MPGRKRRPVPSKSHLTLLDKSGAGVGMLEGNAQKGSGAASWGPLRTSACVRKGHWVLSADLWTVWLHALSFENFP